MLRDLSVIPCYNIVQVLKDILSYSLTQIVNICKHSNHGIRLTVKNQKPNQMTGSGLAKEFVPQQYQGYYWSCGEPDIYNNGVGKKNLHVTHKISSKNMQDRNHPEMRLFPQMPQHNIQILTLIKETISQAVHVLNCFFILPKRGSLV